MGTCLDPGRLPGHHLAPFGVATVYGVPVDRVPGSALCMYFSFCHPAALVVGALLPGLGTGETEARGGGVACPGLGGQSTQGGNRTRGHGTASGALVSWAPSEAQGCGVGLGSTREHPGCRPLLLCGAERGNNAVSIPEQPARSAALTWRWGGEARPRGGLGWAGPGRAGPPASWRPLSGQTLLLPPPAPPGPAPHRLEVGLGVRPTRLCHVCHPAGTHEHLSKFPVGGAERSGRLWPPLHAASAR